MDRDRAAQHVGLVAELPEDGVARRSIDVYRPQTGASGERDEHRRDQRHQLLERTTFRVDMHDRQGGSVR
jgi:hypothetical protein